MVRAQNLGGNSEVPDLIPKGQEVVVHPQAVHGIQEQLFRGRVQVKFLYVFWDRNPTFNKRLERSIDSAQTSTFPA